MHNKTSTALLSIFFPFIHPHFVVAFNASPNFLAFLGPRSPIACKSHRQEAFAVQAVRIAMDMEPRRRRRDDDRRTFYNNVIINEYPLYEKNGAGRARTTTLAWYLENRSVDRIKSQYGKRLVLWPFLQLIVVEPIHQGMILWRIQRDFFLRHYLLSYWITFSSLILLFFLAQPTLLTRLYFALFTSSSLIFVGNWLGGGVVELIAPFLPRFRASLPLIIIIFRGPNDIEFSSFIFRFVAPGEGIHQVANRVIEDARQIFWIFQDSWILLCSKIKSM